MTSSNLGHRLRQHDFLGDLGKKCITAGAGWQVYLLYPPVTSKQVAQHLPSPSRQGVEEYLLEQIELQRNVLADHPRSVPY